MDLPKLHQRASKQTKEFIEKVKKGDLSKISNCSPWTIGNLINHIISENLWVKDIVDGKTISDVGDKYEGDCLGDDFLKAYIDSAKEADGAFAKKGAMGNIVHLSYGNFPGSLYCNHRIIDVAIHGWDVVHSLGGNDEMDPDLVKDLYDLVKPEAKDLQDSGYYGDDVKVSSSAPLQDKLLGLLGRSRH